jgi:hypothetical protein
MQPSLRAQSTSMKTIRLGIIMSISILASEPRLFAQAALLLEQPFGTFGTLNPTGHAAVYLERVCADTPVHVRLCDPDENGVVISRYKGLSGYDWIAIPLIPYLYAVDQPDQVPASVDAETVASLRDAYCRAHLEEIAPDEGGSTPHGDWTQLVGEAAGASRAVKNPTGGAIA